ncbi:MAG: glycosyltransferase family 39 protein, partial [Phycisphaerae bacterium]|nr:glycosyltransferase family 39 protein [Phycisphaerae bacterium]
MSDPSAAVTRGVRFSSRTCVLLLIVASAAFRLFAAWGVGLGYGESYYFSCAMHPALSYFDQPPLASWLAYLSVQIAGRVGPLVLRLPFITLFAGTTWLMFVLTRRLFGARAGLFAALLLNLSAVFTVPVACFLQPDGLLMFFYLACVYCLTRIFFDPRSRRAWLWWVAAGATLGLAMLSKYHAVFIIFGAAVFVITRRRQRCWLRHPGPYLAIAVAAAIFSPVLVWNSQHGWISFLW